MRLDHVQLAMPKGGEAQARTFYGRLLGMREVEKPEELRSRGGCWFQNGGCHVHVGVDPDFRPAQKAHSAFIVEGLAELAERLTESGHHVAWERALPGLERFYVQDPFGNRLEFLASGHGFSERRRSHR